MGWREPAGWIDIVGLAMYQYRHCFTARRSVIAAKPCMRESPFFAWIVDMDIERINAIGTLLADLQNRTEQLRGYL
jgi:hypothetical protein